MEYRCRAKRMIVLVLSSCADLKFFSFELTHNNSKLDQHGFRFVLPSLEISSKWRYFLGQFPSQKALNVGKAVFVTNEIVFFLNLSLPQGPMADNFLSRHITKAWNSRHLQVSNFENFENNCMDFDSFGWLSKLR